MTAAFNFPQLLRECRPGTATGSTRAKRRAKDMSLVKAARRLVTASVLAPLPKVAGSSHLAAAAAAAAASG